MTKFKTGATYQTRSICDHSAVFSYKVVSRTEKTITVVSPIRGKRRCGIKVLNKMQLF